MWGFCLPKPHRPCSPILSGKGERQSRPLLLGYEGLTSPVEVVLVVTLPFHLGALSLSLWGVDGPYLSLVGSGVNHVSHRCLSKVTYLWFPEVSTSRLAWVFSLCLWGSLCPKPLWVLMSPQYLGQQGGSVDRKCCECFWGKAVVVAARNWEWVWWVDRGGALFAS